MQKFLILLFLITTILSCWGSSLEIYTDVNGVKIYLDGKYENKTITFGEAFRFTVDNLDPGPHRVKCLYPGYEPYYTIKEIPEFGAVKMTLDFQIEGVISEEISLGKTDNNIQKKGIIFVTSNPTGAEIYLNDKPILDHDYNDEIMLTDAKLVNVPIGKQIIKCISENKIILEGEFEINPHDVYNVHADYIKREIKVEKYFSRKPFPFAQLGTLKILANREHNGEIINNISIFNNGEDTGEKTTAELKLQSGEYDICLIHPDYPKETRKVKVNGGYTKEVVFEMETIDWLSSKHHSWSRNTWYGLGGTALIAGGSIFCHLQSKSNFDKYEATNITSEAMDFKQKTINYENARDYCMYAASGAAIYSAYSWIKSRNYDKRTK